MELTDFKKIFDLYYDDIVHFLYYKSGDIQLSEDIVQNVFMKLWDKRDAIRKETVKSFLYTIASNELKNYRRKSQLSFDFVVPESEGDSSDSPEFLLEMKEFDASLQSVLAKMPEKSRLVFLMNRIDKMVYADIADRLGISVKAVEKRMHVALSHIKKYINYKI